MAPRGSGRAGRGGAPQALSEILQAFLKRRGLLQEMKNRQWLANWDDLVGATIAEEARPIKVERGILWIGVKSAPQANQLLYLKQKLIERIREVYPDSGIRDLRVLHRPKQGRPE